METLLFPSTMAHTACFSWDRCGHRGICLCLPSDPTRESCCLDCLGSNGF